MSAVRPLIDKLASDLETRIDETASAAETDDVLMLIGERLKLAESLLAGAPMTRPEMAPSETAANARS